MMSYFVGSGEKFLMQACKMKIFITAEQIRTAFNPV